MHPQRLPSLWAQAAFHIKSCIFPGVDLWVPWPTECGGNASETSEPRSSRVGRITHFLLPATLALGAHPSKLSHQARRSPSHTEQPLEWELKGSTNSLGETAAQSAIRVVSFDAPAALRPQMTAAPVNRKRKNQPGFFLVTSRILRVKWLVFQVTIFSGGFLVSIDNYWGLIWVEIYFHKRENHCLHFMKFLLRLTFYYLSHTFIFPHLKMPLLNRIHSHTVNILSMSILGENAK